MTATAATVRARRLSILWVLAAICAGWAISRAWLYPLLGVPGHAPMILRPLLGFAMAWWLIVRAGEAWRDYGLRRAPPWWRLPLSCVALYLAMTLVARYVTPMLAQTLGATSAPSFIAETVHGNAAALCVWLAIAWGVGGFAEELLFRGFLLNRIESALGGRIALATAVVAQAALFGALHYYQGGFGAVSAAIFALVYGVAHPLFGRNLWPLIIVHGVWNTVAIWGAYTA